jgi:O-antigen/teichoic acid export membrane protein
MKTPPSVSPRIVAAAVLLPFLGLFLLMPPVVQLFAQERDLGGVPLIVIYLFGVWLGLIVSAAWLSRYLARSG